MSRRRQSHIPELLQTLVDPRLEGAACVGLAPLFDDFPDDASESADQREARHHKARSICHRCSVRDSCDTAAREQGPEATGIWAGTLHMPTTPRKAAS
ncbi:WhiB family transcriptional regulator [Rhodococcus baikonurensis]|uniref:WhiB family transcriptional regulator n=1 Tax=Rhodococcus baikonurensis TaxID=172041 RepID=A0ABV5XKJ7_9NOCA